MNINDQTGTGVLSQSFATTSGQRYEVAFDYGVVGPISDQRLQVTLEGNGVLVDTLILIAGIDHQPFYVPQHVYFVANSASTKLTFADASFTYVVIDSLLDNVQVHSVNTNAPVITTAPQRTAVAQGNNATFTVTATGATSYQWQFNEVNIPGATNSSYTVTSADSAKAGNYSVIVTNANGSVTSSAATLTVLPPAILLNGSFEYGSAAWTFSNTNVATSTNPGYGISDGTVLTHFNWGQQPANANISQVFATTAGQTYIVEFDLGAFSVSNQNQQGCRVSVTDAGNNTLVSRNFAVFASGTGGRYFGQQLIFMASGSTAKLTFQDISPTTTDLDLLLDNVRVRIRNSAPLPLVNSSFEAGPVDTNGTVNGWTVGGTNRVVVRTAEGSTAGTAAAVFGAGGESQGDTLSQSFATTIGQAYTVDFDAGIFGTPANGANLQLRTQIFGTASLLDLTATLPVNTGPTPADPTKVPFAHYHYVFTANSDTTTLQFTDVGSGNTNADQILDSVAVTPAP